MLCYITLMLRKARLLCQSFLKNRSVFGVDAQDKASWTEKDTRPLRFLLLGRL